MGNTKLRRLYTEQTRWTDFNSPRHKHSFSRHAVMCLYSVDDIVKYFDVMCCTQCHSFKCISKEHNISGLITDLADIDRSLPLLVFHTSHNARIGFSDLEFVEER